MNWPDKQGVGEGTKGEKKEMITYGKAENPFRKWGG